MRGGLALRLNYDALPKRAKVFVRSAFIRFGRRIFGNYLRARKEEPRLRPAIAGCENRDVLCPACGPSQNSSIIFRLKAGRSAGLRLVTRPLSTTTCSSTQSAPAFLRSVLIDG